MALPTIVNSVNCGASEILGTGLKNCKQDIKRVTTLGLIERGFKFDEARSFELAYIQELQQKGQLVILQGVVELTDNTAEDTIITRAGSGEKIVAGKNPYEYNVMFDNGLAFHKALTALSGHRRFDLVMWDSKGDAIFTQTKAGEYKGFTLGMFENGKYTMSNGADASSQSVSFQMVNRLEFDERVSWITADNLDYNAQEDLDGVNDAVFAITAPTAGTSVLFTVKTLADNHQVSLSGLLKTDLLYAVDGVTTAITTLVESTTEAGKYTLTVPAFTTGKVLTLVTYDTVLLKNIINLDGVLYKSNVASTIAL